MRQLQQRVYLNFKWNNILVCDKNIISKIINDKE